MSRYSEKELKYQNRLNELKKAGSGPCICCGDPGMTDILLYNSNGRYYLSSHSNLLHDECFPECGYVAQWHWFCQRCMHILEDNLRATILYLQSENRPEGGLKAGAYQGHGEEIPND